VVGHSISGGTVSLYASRYPTRGVINIDGLPDPVLLARLRSAEKQIRGDGFPGVWAALKQSFGTDQLPPAARELVVSTSHPRQDLVVSYWDEVLSQAPGQMDEMLAAGFAAVAASGVPYVLIAGSEPPAGITQRMSDAGIQMKTEVWAGTGHFPHLAHPGRFAQQLAAAALLPPLPASPGVMTSGEMDRVIDAHFDAERRNDVAAILDTVSADIVHELFGAGLDQLRGKDAVRAFYEQLGQDLRIDGYTTVRRIHGADHAWEEGVVHATATGKPFGFEGGGRSVTYQLNHLFEFRHGLICRELGIPDGASILHQLSQPA
jgi:ketosteroid isomerase-like protein